MGVGGESADFSLPEVCPFRSGEVDVRVDQENVGDDGRLEIIGAQVEPCVVHDLFQVVSGFEKFDGVETGDRNGSFTSVVEVDVIRNHNNIHPQLSKCPDEGDGEVQGLDHASCKLREVEVDGPDFLGGRSMRFWPGADGWIVDVEGSIPQKASLFKDARKAGTAKECDGDGGEEAFVVCARGVGDLELFELAGSFASFPHGVSHGHPQVGEADSGGSGGFASEDKVKQHWPGRLASCFVLHLHQPLPFSRSGGGGAGRALEFV